MVPISKEVEIPLENISIGQEGAGIRKIVEENAIAIIDEVSTKHYDLLGFIHTLCEGKKYLIICDQDAPRL